MTEPIRLWWDYAPNAHTTGAVLPPRRPDGPTGARPADSPFCKDFHSRWRAVESGYTVRPSECGPVRLISRYGFVLSAPKAAWFRRVKEPSKERRFSETSASFGEVEVGGEPWPGTDSGFVASWIAGSSYVKIHTGIHILFPREVLLYQGPIPYPGRHSSAHVMAGLEFWSLERTQDIGGVPYGICEANVICKLPPAGITSSLEAGEDICWVFPALRPKDYSLAPLSSDLRVVAEDA